MYLFTSGPRGLWDLSSQTRDWTRATAVKAQNPNHEATMEFPILYEFIYIKY